MVNLIHLRVPKLYLNVNYTADAVWLWWLANRPETEPEKGAAMIAPTGGASNDKVSIMAT